MADIHNAPQNRLQQQNPKPNADKKGFTLIEMLVVVFIIILLASTFLVSTSRLRGKSRDERRKNDLQAIQAALELYYAQNKRFPTNCPVAALAEGVNSRTAPTGYSEGQAPWPSRNQWINHAPKGSDCLTPAPPGNTQFTSRYIGAVPLDPLNNSEFFYRYKTDNDTNAQRYELDVSFEINTQAMLDDGGDDPNKFEIFNRDGGLL